MKTLPKLPYKLKKSKSEIVQLRGINYSDDFRDGDLAESENVSSIRYPYFSSEHAVSEYSPERTGVFSAVAWQGGLLYVKNGHFCFDIESSDPGVIATYTSSYATRNEVKQYVVFNDTMIVWPDKVYVRFDTDNRVLTAAPLGASAGEYNTATVGTDYIQIEDESVDFRELFAVGDVLTVKHMEIIEGQETHIASYIAVTSVEENKIYTTENAFEPGELSDVTISRDIPEMDYICEYGGRLWGCGNNTIYASAFNDPTNFNILSPGEASSYVLEVGDYGDFTGCCRYSSSVLFWKEKKLYKILGSNPEEFTLYSYDTEGVKKGCGASIQNINEALYFMGTQGVCVYTGGVPKSISSNFGNRIFTEAVAGTDGRSYLVSVKEGSYFHLFEYDTKYGIWLHKNDSRAKQFTLTESGMLFVGNDGKLYTFTRGRNDPNGEWSMQFKPFYETIEGRKTYSRLLFRVELSAGSYMIAEVRTDGGTWHETGRIDGGKSDVVPMRIPIERCDKFEIKLSGKGAFALLSMMREYRIGSEA